MTLRLLSADPSAVVLDAIQTAMGDVPAGYDMPPGGRKLFLTLSAGAQPTAATQRWTLTISAYSHTESGIMAHADAQALWRKAVLAVIEHRYDEPLCDAAIQSGPMENHDAKLGVDYVYGALMLTIACA
ncbi:hypothetical protein [Bifidobacterium animalis]|uniref:hypothetical protein n=1 Tax=Bifidobacterium animalis TaxID=28025 RepID=UPI001C3EC19A|nr:hypothetical protein [Bifidobacterium animalis]MCR1995730.1 hypothetical protein [Bifidobacterium animalis subsp. animalis]